MFQWTWSVLAALAGTALVGCDVEVAVESDPDALVLRAAVAATAGSGTATHILSTTITPFVGDTAGRSYPDAGQMISPEAYNALMEAWERGGEVQMPEPDPPIRLVESSESSADQPYLAFGAPAHLTEWGVAYVYYELWRSGRPLNAGLVMLRVDPKGSWQATGDQPLWTFGTPE